MRWVYLALLVVLITLLVVFVAQNRDNETFQFLHFSITAPLYMFFVAVYILGMWTGGTVVGFVKRTYKQATEPGQKRASQKR